MPTIPVRRRRINVRAIRQQAHQLLSTMPGLLRAQPEHPDIGLLQAAANFHDLTSSLETLFAQSMTLDAEEGRTNRAVLLERQANRECLVAAATRPSTMLGSCARAAMLVLMDETLTFPSRQPS